MRRKRVERRWSAKSRIGRLVRVVSMSLALTTGVIVAAFLALQADSLWPFTLPIELEPVGWFLLIPGALLIVSAEHALFTVAHATGAPGDPPQKLVTTGPYGWMRNPIYIGATALLFAVAFIDRSPTLLLVAFAFVPGICLFVQLVEEPRAERRFGAWYLDYKRRVPRWIPRWPKRNDRPAQV